jgi:hypothetical protein
MAGEEGSCTEFRSRKLIYSTWLSAHKRDISCIASISSSHTSKRVSECTQTKIRETIWNSPIPSFFAYSWSWARSCQLRSHSRNNPSILWNPKVHYRVHKSPPLVPILSKINSIHIIPFYLCKIHFNTVHPPTSWSSQWFLPSGFPTNILYAFCFAPFVLCAPPTSSSLTWLF